MRILLVTSVPPSPASGGGRRTDLFLESLERLGTVDVAALGPRWPDLARARAGSFGGGHLDLTTPGPPRHGKDLWQRLGPVRFRLDGWRRARQTVTDAHQRRPWDIVIYRYIHAFATVGPIPHAPALVDVDDLPSEVRATSASARGPRRGLIDASRNLFAARRLAAAERTCLSRADGLWISAPTHADLLNRGDAILLPNTLRWPEANPEAPTPNRPPTALFLGPLWHEPNRVGLRWMTERIWPRVRERLADARLLIAGEGHSSETTAGEGIECLGFVPDLDELYERIDLATAPLFSGSGTSLKVVEALGRGRPCLATPFAVRHLGDLVPKSALLVREPDQWVEALIEALLNRQKLNESARREALGVRSKLNLARFQRCVDSLVEQVSARVI